MNVDKARTTCTASSPLCALGWKTGDPCTLACNNLLGAIYNVVVWLESVKWVLKFQMLDVLGYGSLVIKQNIKNSQLVDISVWNGGFEIGKLWGSMWTSLLVKL